MNCCVLSISLWFTPVIFSTPSWNINSGIDWSICLFGSSSVFAVVSELKNYIFQSSLVCQVSSSNDSLLSFFKLSLLKMFSNETHQTFSKMSCLGFLHVPNIFLFTRFGSLPVGFYLDCDISLFSSALQFLLS